MMVAFTVAGHGNACTPALLSTIESAVILQFHMAFIASMTTSALGSGGVSQVHRCIRFGRKKLVNKQDRRELDLILC